MTEDSLKEKNHSSRKSLVTKVAASFILGGVSIACMYGCHHEDYITNVNVKGTVIGEKWKTRSGKSAVLKSYTLVTDNLGEIEVLYDRKRSIKPYFDILFEADEGDQYRMRRFFIRDGKIHTFIDDIEIINK